MHCIPRLRPAILALAAAALASSAGAQVPAPSREVLPALGAGAELEGYLRALQIAGAVPLHPWSVRAFSPREARRLVPSGEHPWSRFYGPSPADSAGGARIVPVPAELSARYNSAFPYGFNDGPVWAGRGATVALTAGAALRAGPLTVQVAPVAFAAQNRGFELAPHGEADRPFLDPVSTEFIDMPQRFGDGGYQRVDPGESFVRLDLGPVAMGLSTAAQVWGPGADQPLILGNNAGGFPHVFLGTTAPVNIGIGRLHGRVLWGELRQSPYSPVEDGHGTRRLASGMVATFTPAGVPGLEVGGTRFYHVAWPEGGVGARDLLHLFDPFPKTDLPDDPGGRWLDNQLASVFARWVFPSAGVEFHGEYAREDHNWDMLDLFLEPDHSRAWSVGFRKAWLRGTALRVVRAEWMDAIPGSVAEGRQQAPFYQHAGTPQGHTLQGQVLGAPFAHGGGGSVLGFDSYHRRGRWSVAWTRGRVAQRWFYDEDGTVERPDTDVLHALSADAVWMGRAVDVTFGAAAVYELNRQFRDDAFNLNARFGLRLPF